MARRVAPFTGAWIEIATSLTYYIWDVVAPFTGAWIEMLMKLTTCISSGVAPFTGAWIEIFLVLLEGMPIRSLPSRERGLKLRDGRFLGGGAAGRSLHGSVD